MIVCRRLKKVTEEGQHDLLGGVDQLARLTAYLPILETTYIRHGN